MGAGGVKMEAVHKCGQRYVHVHERLTPRHAGSGRVGSLTNK